MRSCTPHLGCASRLRTVRVPRSIVSRAASAQASAEVVATSDGGAGHGFSQAHTSQRSAGAQILPHARIPPLMASGCFVSCAPPRLHRRRRLGTVTDAASRGLSSLLLMMIAIWHTIGPFLKTPAHKSLPPCTMHSLSLRIFRASGSPDGLSAAPSFPGRPCIDVVRTHPLAHLSRTRDHPSCPKHEDDRAPLVGGCGAECKCIYADRAPRIRPTLRSPAPSSGPEPFAPCAFRAGVSRTEVGPVTYKTLGSPWG